MSPLDRYEMELVVYQSELRNYQDSLPHLKQWLAMPITPNIASVKHWDMRNVTTHSRRNWK